MNLIQKFHEHVKNQPDKIALIVDQSKVSYKDLSHQMGYCISELKSRIRSGDRILVYVTSKKIYVPTILSILSLGGIVVPLDERAKDQIDYFIKDCEPALYVTDRAETATTMVPTLVFGSLELKSTSEKLTPNTDDPALILYTSGTTGERKGALLTHRQFYAPAIYMNERMKYHPNLVEFGNGALDHAFALGRLRCALAGGATFVCSEGGFNPYNVLHLIEQHRCTALSSPGSGIMLLAEYNLDELSKFKDQLQWIKMGSQSISPDLVKKLIEALPSTQVYYNFGLSEAQRTCVINFQDDKDKLASSGPPAGKDIQIKIVDEDLKEVEPGTVGNILVKGPQVFEGYWKRPEQTKDKIRDGWLISGDLGYVDEDGYLFYASRKDELINIGGEKISPLDIERSISKFVPTSNFCVCAYNVGGAMGQAVAICFEDESFVKGWRDIKKSMIRNVDPKMIPTQAFFLEKFPRTSTNKIQRNRITSLIS